MIYSNQPLVASAASGGPGVTDWLTGIGTIALALVTVVALIATFRITTTDRRRADAAQQNAERARRRERQQDSAQRLLVFIAGLLPNIDLVPGALRIASLPAVPAGYDPRFLECRDAVRALEFSAHAELFGLGDARAADQYRQLVHLVLTAAGGVEKARPKHVADELRRYAIFVQVSLANLIEHGESFDPGWPAFPQLDRSPADESLWSPEGMPEAWLDALRHEPADPLFEPAA